MAHPGTHYGRRVAIVGGLRTPFMKAGTKFRDLSTLELGALVTNELLHRSNLDAGQVDQPGAGTTGIAITFSRRQAGDVGTGGEIAERDIFAEGHEVMLVIARRNFARRVEKNERVVKPPLLDSPQPQHHRGFSGSLGDDGKRLRGIGK